MSQDTSALLHQSEERFRLLIEAIQDYSIYMLDPQGRVATWNIGAQRNKGYTSSEIIGKSFSVFFQPEDIAARIPDGILAAAGASDKGHAVEGWRVRKDGTRFWASVVVNAMRDSDGQLIGFAKITRDLTERRETELALQAERDRLQVTLYSIADGVICTDELGKITLMNSVAESLTGWMLAYAKGRPVEEAFRLLDANDDGIVANPIRDCLAHKGAFYLQENVVLVARNGSRCYVQDSAAPIRASDGTVLGAVLVFQDVTKLRAAQREMAFSATHDSLTLLPNRKHFQATLQDVLQQSKATGHEQTVCFLDLDRFKVVNDTVGHAAGDVLLRTVSGLLSRCLRSSDLVARVGGDEFALILRGCTVEQARNTLTKIRDNIAALNFLWEGRLFKISVSIGVTVMTAESDISDVMKEADVACYAAKNAGRNRISVYQPNQGEGHERHQQLEIAADIRDAIAQNRFSLFAQKIAAIGATQVSHYEILLRMHDCNGAMISPNQFIPAAERYDLMGDVDRWVLKRVLLHEAERLNAIPDIQLSINLSANSLNDSKFLPFFLNLIEHSPLSPCSLTLEITETSLINHLGSASNVMDKLRSIGCKIALDDFGIGLSSFSYLRNFKVDYIKIEGSFVKNIPHSSTDLAIVKAINNIAHEIGTQTIAEYVEDEAILGMLSELDVDFAQGYFLGRPEPIETLFRQLPDGEMYGRYVLHSVKL